MHVLPTGRWLKILARSPVGSKLIVCLSFLRIFQDFIRLTHFLEFFLCTRFTAYIRVIFSCKSAVSPLDITFFRISLYAQCFIVIFILHTCILCFRSAERRGGRSVPWSLHTS